MKKWAEVALGVVTSMGGFLEVGSIATSVQAGAGFGFQLAWALALGTLSLAILMEMTGRLAAVSGRSYVDLLRATRPRLAPPATRQACGSRRCH